MHEWALAEGVILTALNVAKEEELKEITTIAVKIGELQQISVDFFKQSLEAVLPSEDGLLANVEFLLEIEQAQMKCRACDCQYQRPETHGDLEKEKREAIHFIPELAHSYLACPNCESQDFEIVQGRGVRIDFVEGNS